MRPRVAAGRPRSRTRLATVAVLALALVTAGCMAPLATHEDTPGAQDRDLGTVYGYEATDRIEIEDPSSLTETELEALTYRTMARIEVIRGLQFTDDVDIEFYTREEIRERYDHDGEPASAFTNELWRGAFVVDGDTDVNEAFDRLYGDAVAGFYLDGRIVVVVDDPDTVSLDRDTFVHELTHALQDQQFGLERESTTIDGLRAENGLIEGEANYVPYLYAQYCERDPEWECLPTADELETADGVSDDVEDAAQPADELNVGLFLSIFAPYSEGPTFVQHLHETGGWAAVDDAFEDRPASTSQIIHPDRYPDDRPVDVEVPDRSSSGWMPMTDDDGEVKTETVGEATLFSTLLANGAIDHDLTTGDDLSPYNYSHPATDGWAGDTFVAYEDEGATAVGHVWALEWQSDADAERFAAAYERLLEERGAEAVSGAEDTYRVPADEPFAGTYRVTVDDDRVELVGGPSVNAIEAIRPPADTDVDVHSNAWLSAPVTSPSTTGAGTDVAVASS